LPLSATPITSISQIPKPIELSAGEQTKLIFPSVVRSKRILVVDPVETARSSLVKLIGTSVERIDSFETFDRGILMAKVWRETYNEPLYDIVFCSVREDNAEEVKKAVKELRVICGEDYLCIVLMVYWSANGRTLGQKLTSEIGGQITVLCKPIMQKRLLDCLYNNEIFKSSTSSATKHRRNYSSVKSLADIRVEKYYHNNRPSSAEKEPAIIKQLPEDNNKMIIDQGEAPQIPIRERLKRTVSSSSVPTKRTTLKRMELGGEDTTKLDEDRASKFRSRPVTKSKRILCVVCIIILIYVHCKIM
jgi:hypothetical protein